jgi:ABC-type branched-subunit amino acid transport system ATPase component
MSDMAEESGVAVLLVEQHVRIALELADGAVVLEGAFMSRQEEGRVPASSKA